VTMYILGHAADHQVLSHLFSPDILLRLSCRPLTLK
jgi:hypothetical protein